MHSVLYLRLKFLSFIILHKNISGLSRPRKCTNLILASKMINLLFPEPFSLFQGSGLREWRWLAGVTLEDSVENRCRHCALFRLKGDTALENVSRFYKGVGTLHIITSGDTAYYSESGGAPHMKLCSNVHTGVGTPHKSRWGHRT